MEFLSNSSNSGDNIYKIEVHSDDPTVFTIDDLISNEECEHFINISKNNMKDSLVSHNTKGELSSGRTSTNTWINHNTDEITLNVGNRIAKIINMPLENAEKYQVIHYDINGQYCNHYDSWLHDGSEKTLRCMKYGGARLVTALVYLNDVEEGGSTRLNKLDLNISAKKGKLLVFQNTYSGTNIRHTLSEHAGMPVLKGEKYAFNLWFKECKSSRLYSEFNPSYYSNIGFNTNNNTNNTNNINLKNDTIFHFQNNNSVYNSIIDKSVNNENSTTENVKKIYKYNYLSKMKNIERITNKKNIYKKINFLNFMDYKPIIQKCDFSKCSSKYLNCWIPNSDFPIFIKNIENQTGINSQFYENLNIFKYLPEQIHGPFIDAYDLSSVNGKKYTKNRGQRIYTISIPLNNSIQIKFGKLNEVFDIQQGSFFIYDNISNDSRNIRDTEIFHTIINNNDDETYVLNINIREKDMITNNLMVEMVEIVESSENNLIIENTDNNKNNNFIDITSIDINNLMIDGNKITIYENQHKISKQELSIENIPSKENYNTTLSYVLNLFKENKISLGWSGYKSFNYTFKGEIEYFKEKVNQFIESRKTIKEDSTLNLSALNNENLVKNYLFDEYNPVIVQNVLNNETLKICQEYYSTTINNGAYTLGDKQSKRFKAHNEPMGRILQYEILPLIEKIVGKSLQPTYTYLSAYVKDSDLPAHTDRPDCEYTVSFIINKPENVRWPIYFHKEKQPVKNKGRYNWTPSKEECIEVDCNAGGLMMFQGTDHIHFREKLEYDFYYIVLLHYRTV